MEKVEERTELTEEQERIMEEVFGETREEMIAALKQSEEEIERGEYMDIDIAFEELKEKYGF